MGAPDSIYRLVEKFERHKPGSETEVRVQFVDELFRALGWDMRDKRQVRHEPRVIIKEAGFERSKRPDYSFHTGNPADFYVETKMPHVNLERNPIPAFQLRRYGWSGNAPVSVLTDFEEFSVYDCRIQPQRSDPAKKARLRYLQYGEYIDRWDELESRFSREAVARGALREWVEGERVRGLFSVDQAFLREMETWREALAQDIALHNRELSQRQLNLLVQRAIDRIVFLRIAEDRDIEAYGRLRSAAASGKQVYDELKILFNEADDKYNSGLFHFGAEARASQPDTLSLRIHIPDAPLRRIISSLYFPTSPYEFSALSADILGQVYEQFLGKVIEISGGVRVEEKPEVRKAGGVYYTPAYIVDYIVENTVGDLLRGKSPKEAEKLRILDPACGSGSFLTGAYQYLLDWHLKVYSAEPRRYRNVIRAVRGRYVLTTVEKRRILENSIYGVDLDQNAVEVSKLSLLLKMLENEDGSDATGLQTVMFSAGERILPDLSGNIKWGNSLIGSDFYSGEQLTLFDDEALLKVKPFDWEGAEGFGEIMAAGGFDAVIGNPPYVFTRNQGIDKYQKAYFYDRFHHQSAQLNTFGLFVERSYQILANGGLLGYIIPNNWLTIDSFSQLRDFILSNTGNVYIYNILDKVFGDANVDSAIVGFRKSESTTLTIGEIKDQSIVTEVEVAPSEINPPSFIIQIALLKDVEGKRLIDKVNAISEPLQNSAKVSTGLKVYQRGKGDPAQTNQEKAERIFHARKMIDATYGKYLDGVDVQRFNLDWSGQYLSYGKWIAEMRKSVPYDGERILVRQIPSKLPYTVNAVFTKEAYYNDINSMVIFNPISVSLKYVLGVINSRLISYWFVKTYDKLQRKIFPQFKVKELKQFPIRTIDFDNPGDLAMHDEMIKLVDEILSRHKQLPRLTGEGRRITEALIRTVDEKIDALIYRLYGLSNDEIAIVEGG